MVATFGAVTDGRWRAWTRENEQVLAICGATVLVMAGQGITGPVLPLFARDFGVATSTVGLTITFFALAWLIFNVPRDTWPTDSAAGYSSWAARW